MFRNKRGIYQTRRQFSRPVAILLFILLSLIVLELLVRGFAGITGQGDELAAYEGARKIITAYRFTFLDLTQAPYDGLPNRGDLIAQRSLLMGYKLLGNQQSEFWRINEQGFRADEPVPLKKPQGEIRIFVLGGATAFGYLSLNNQTTFAGQLEERLKQQVEVQKRNPEKFRADSLPGEEPNKAQTLQLQIRDAQYRVINAAVPGYTSGNEAAQVALDILAYNPDLIVLVNGYEDLMLPSSLDGADIPGIQIFLQNASVHFFASSTQGLRNWVSQSYLVKAVQYWVLRPHEIPLKEFANQLSVVAKQSEVPLAKYLAADAEEQQRRVRRYQQNLQQIARLTAPAKIPLIVAIQPEITGRGQNNPIPDEREIVERLGEVYIQRVEQGYSQLGGAVKELQQQFPKDVTVLNLYNFYAGFGEQAFQDAVHLSDAANAELANRLYATVAALLQPQVKPQN